MFARYTSLACFLLVVVAGRVSVAQETAYRQSTGRSGAGGGTVGQDEYSYVIDPDLPTDDYSPTEDDLKRLVVEWGKTSVGYKDYEQWDGDEPTSRLWKDDDTLRPDRRLAVRGRLLIVSADGKTRQPIHWVQGVRIVVSRRADQKHDWSKRHEVHQVDWGDAIIWENGEFLATLSPAAIIRPVAKEAVFQVALSLGKREGHRITWRNTDPVLPQSVTMLSFPGPPPISETMRIINGSPSFSPNNFNPGKLVRAVNHLRPMGKEKALEELRAFLKVARDCPDVHQRIDENIDTSDYTSVFLIVRLLFEPSDPDEKLPPILTIPFTPELEEQSPDLPLWPLHPLHLQDDVPFILVYGGAMGGMPEHPSSHVDWAARFGKIRDNPLRPVGNPMHAAERLAAMPQTKRLLCSDNPEFEYSTFLLKQALNAVNDADPLLPNPPPLPPINTWNDEKTEADIRAASRLDIQWDPKQQSYILKRR